MDTRDMSSGPIKAGRRGATLGGVRRRRRRLHSTRSRLACAHAPNAATPLGQGIGAVKEVLFRASEWPVGIALSAATRFVIRSATLRFEPSFSRSPAIFVHWHAHLPLLLGLCGQARHWAMVSGAPYMAPVARMSTLLGLRLARGATGAGGKDALKVLEAALLRGEAVELAVDGPTGPAFRVKAGCVDLALRTGAPIVALAYRVDHFVITPRRWDRQVLPAPFSTIDVLAREVPRDTGDSRDTLRDKVQATLDALRAEAGNA